MKSTRRGFLGAVIGAAVALGVMPKDAGAASGRPVVPPDNVHLDAYFKGWDDMLASGLATRDEVMDTRQALSASVADSPVSERLEPYVQETWHAPLTFEAMRLDCAARGCAELTADPFWNAVYRVPGMKYGHGDEAFVMQGEQDLSMIDAWRRSLHGKEG